MAGTLPCGWGLAVSSVPLPSPRRILTILISYGAPSSYSRTMKRDERDLGAWNSVIMGVRLDTRARHGKGVDAQRAGQGAGAACLVDAFDQPRHAAAGVFGFCLKHNPEFFFQGHRGAMARERERALFQHGSLFLALTRSPGMTASRSLRRDHILGPHQP